MLFKVQGIGNRFGTPNRTKVKRVHYNNGSFNPLCQTTHGHLIALTQEKSMVTCKVCLHLLSTGKQIPVNEKPVVIGQLELAL